MTRERVLYPNPLANELFVNSTELVWVFFYFRLFLRVSALSGRAGPSADRSTLVSPVPLNVYTNDMNKCGEHKINGEETL
jgi:hypothetical protein